MTFIRVRPSNLDSANDFSSFVGSAYGTANSAAAYANAAYLQANNALPKTGGIVTGNLMVSTTGTMRIQNTSPTISNNTGALIIDGGLAIKGNTWISGVFTVDGDFQVGNQTTTGNVYNTGVVTFSQPTLFISNTSAISNSTGAIVVTGGVGIKGNLYSGSIRVTGSTSNGITFADGTTQYTANSGTDAYARSTANAALIAATSNSAATLTYTPQFAGAIITLSTSQALGTATYANVNLDTTAYDTTGTDFTNTSGRITIPAGVTKVRLTGHALGSTLTDQFITRITKNGSAIISTIVDIDSTGQDAAVAIVPVTSVVAGDYFQLQAYSQLAGRTVISGDYTWLALEVVEGSILNTTVYSTLGLRDLTVDVDIATIPPTSEQSLVWNASSSKWIPGTTGLVQGSYANSAYGVANSAALYANAAFLQANTPSATANSAALYANAAFIQANAAYAQANSGGAGTDTYARDTANAAFLQANAAFIQANSGSGITYTASNTAPSVPHVGDQWYIIATDVLYEYINDGTSNNWVDIVSPTLSNITGSVATTETISPFLLMGA